MTPIQSSPSDARSAPKKRRKLTLQEKVELLDMYCRLRSAAAVAHCPCNINESSVKKNNNDEAVIGTMP